MTPRRSLLSVLVILLSIAVADRAVGQTAQLAGNPSAKVLIPHESWTCGMADGIPAPESGSLIFELQMKFDKVLDVGKTPFGDRRVIVVQDGTASGPKLTAAVMPGALDFELKLSNGTMEIEQILVLKTNDGKYVYVRNAGTGADSSDVRVVMDFEAPNAAPSAWLNSGKYVARRSVDVAAKTLTMRVYDVTAVSLPAGSANVMRIKKPAGTANQPWDYRRAAPSEKQGSVLITETVTLSPSQSVGMSKRGNRNIIPITGGELTGRIPGKVLFGGADYQNLSAPPAIDARYLWQTNDGDIIIVRNTGSGTLIPTFEARVDSPYAFLNIGLFRSSPPGIRPGGVGITMYESIP
jgi:Protein of unknown function (DUF3237)